MEKKHCKNCEGCYIRSSDGKWMCDRVEKPISEIKRCDMFRESDLDD